MRKILFVATVVRLHINVFHLPCIRWFHDQGWKVYVAARNDFENPEDCLIPYCDHYYDIPFERNPWKIGNIKGFRKLQNLIEKEHFELVYCHTPVGAMLSRIANAPFRKKGTKCIYMAHGFHFYSGAPLLNWLIYYPVERFLSRFTDGLITINQEDYRRAQKFHAIKTVLIPGVGIDLGRFQGEGQAKQELRKRLSISEEQFVLMSVGELSERKNHMVVIKALARLKEYDILYLICGDGPLQEQLQAEAEKLGIGNRVRLLGFRQDISELLAVADVFVFPSLQEGLPVAMMEAMASGLPIVASEIRGNKDLLQNNQGGYLVKAREPGQFAEAVVKMMQTPGKRDEMGKHNIEVIKNYSQEAVLQKMKKFFNEVVGGLC